MSDIFEGSFKRWPSPQASIGAGGNGRAVRYEAFRGESSSTWIAAKFVNETLVSFRHAPTREEAMGKFEKGSQE